ncbi:Ribosome-binding factor A domain [Trinorchestia longiramus]|nr:Ribosome-binding factor A domain [Trinorchestia longiramus]
MKLPVTIRGQSLALVYSGLSRASFSCYESNTASQPAGNVIIGQSVGDGSLLYCKKSVNLCSVRTFLVSSPNFKRPGKPSGINKSKSMFNYTRKFLDGGMPEPDLIYNTVTGRPEPKFKKTYISSGTSPRRLQVLNKLFFDHVRDVMTSGMFPENLIGYDFHVTKVRVLDDLMGVYVYYLQTGDDPELPEELLKNLGRIVRKELHALHFTPQIPPITFKKDESFDNVLEVERRLSIIAQEEQLQRQSGQLEAVDQLRLAAPAVPDVIFDDDFKYDPSSPLNFAAATAQRSNPKNRPQSSFTPFAPRFSYKREQQPPNPTWNRPVRVEWTGAASGRVAPRQVPLLTNTLNLNRAAIMSRVEQGLSRVNAFKNDGIDINVYEANMMDLSLDRKLLEGNDLEQQQRWEPVLNIMPRTSLQHWAQAYTKKNLRSDKREKDVDFKAGEPVLRKALDEDYEDIKYYEIEDELLSRTEAPDYFEDDSCN